MIELVNLTNYEGEPERLFSGKRDELEGFLRRHGIRGVELLAGNPVRQEIFPRGLVVGSHLMFWPTWMSFWRKDEEAPRRDVGTSDKVRLIYGTENVEEWIQIWRENIRRSVEAGAEYLVLHIAESEPSAVCSRNFTVTDEEVIEEAAKLINVLTEDIPENCMLLFENLWWPGLTLLKQNLAERLLSEVRHKKCGFMLDTGHLMNTNLNLKNEKDGIEYVLRVFNALGSLRKYVRGIHLHQSQSGAYVREMQKKHAGERWPSDPREIAEYIGNVDCHFPFMTAEAGRILDAVEPEYLVHEFIQVSAADWEHKLHVQRHSLGWE